MGQGQLMQPVGAAKKESICVACKGGELRIQSFQSRWVLVVCKGNGSGCHNNHGRGSCVGFKGSRCGHESRESLKSRVAGTGGTIRSQSRLSCAGRLNGGQRELVALEQGGHRFEWERMTNPSQPLNW